MKKNIIWSAIYVLFIFNSIGHGYNNLRVLDPQNSWRSGQGTIESAVISVRPQGLYMEIGLYLTFSARGLYFNANDTLEVEFYFDLPQNSLVHDLWLWVEDDIIRGELLDVWKASAIYEDIVKRRRDPAILFKRSQTQYELRIFPMAGNQSRKVKITYLVPAQLASNSISALLPMNLLRTSKYTMNNFNVLYWPSAKWSNPAIPQDPLIKFESKLDPLAGSYYDAWIPGNKVYSSLEISLASPLYEGIYLSAMSKGGEGFYQMAFLPSKVLSLNYDRKIAVLLDYDVTRTTLSQDDIINSLKYYLLSNFTEKDSINLILAGTTIKRVRSSWVSADSSAIEELFSSLGSNPLPNYSTLPALIQNGVEFIKETGMDGSILLLSGADQLGDYRAANDLLEQLKITVNPLPPVFVGDLTNTNYSYSYFNNRYYYGNEYFYLNLTRISNGSYSHMRSGQSLSQILSELFQSLDGFISSFDLHTTMEDGFCFGRFNMGTQSTVYLNTPVMQIGKFIGTSNFKIQAAGVFKGSTFSQSLSFDLNELETYDSLTNKIWAGYYISTLEAQPLTNPFIDEIIDQSISNRVLSTYSAFLCLEPSDTILACMTCLDETKFVSVEDELENEKDIDSLSIKAYPNPFNLQTKIVVEMPKDFNESGVSFKIFNVLGQIVKTFELNTGNHRNSFQLEWDGKDDNGNSISSGVYIFLASGKNFNKSLKLLLMK